MSHVWIVESRSWFGKEWIPCMGFKDARGNDIAGTHRVRQAARRAARLMQAENQYNSLTEEFICVYYRAAKYVRED